MNKESAIHLKNITKSYPGVIANKNVEFQVNKGEIHALVGENGAGKSTLMKILYGIEQPDEGEIFINEEKHTISKVETAINLGIGMVHQEFTLVPSFTAPENIGLGQEPRNSKGLIDWKGLNKLVVEIAEKYGFKVDPGLKMIDASVGVQQRTEILKTLYRNANILILDEPTAVLTPQETDELFNVIRTLVDEGKTVIFITHKLREVMEIADRVTVMRNGEVQGVSETKNTSITELASQMVGREVFLQVKKEEAQPKEEILNVQDLWVHDARGLLAVNGVSLSINAGEIVGIAGVEGNGQSELVEALTGLRKASKGTVHYLGEDIASSSPKNIRRKKVAHIPEDRTNTGLNTQLSIWENLIGNSYFRKPLSSRGIFNLKKIAKHANSLKEDFDIRAPSVSLKVKSLSGGNQQKVVVARELSEDPTLTIASQPTRGVDIGNIEAIHEQLVQMRDEGGAVLLVSAELDEVMAVADRVAVMYEGQIVKWVNPKEVDQAQMGL
ncbi:MAG: ABC transporter ATP-binding protein, partial [Candidatus Actinomarina sp.]